MRNRSPYAGMDRGNRRARSRRKEKMQFAHLEAPKNTMSRRGEMTTMTWKNESGGSGQGVMLK